MDGIISGNVAEFGDDLLKKLFGPPTRDTVIETPHPYPDNMDQNWEFIVPGVDYLTLTFDPGCRCENGCDYLEVFMGPNKTQQFPNDGHKYTGRDDTNQWPREPVRVPSNKVFLYFHSDGSVNDWGFRVTISAPPAKDANKVSHTEKAALFTASGWNLTDDIELGRMANLVCDKTNMDRPWGSIIGVQEKFREFFTKDEYKDKNIPIDLMVDRIPVLNTFNSTLERCLPFINLSTKNPESHSILGRINRLRSLIYDNLKTTFFYAIVAKTHGGDQPELMISRVKGIRALEAGDIDNTVFGQLARHCKSRDMVNRLRSSEQAWKTKLQSEGAIDAGGPYRECFSTMANELHSGNHLLSLCPNGKFNIGQNRDKFLPRPSFNTAHHLELYRFLGVLMGIVLRTKGNLVLNFPTMIWKALVNDTPTLQDLEAIDGTALRAVESIRNIDQSGVDADTFADLFFETFTTYLADGSSVELIPGGRNIDLTFHNRFEYCDLVLQTQMHAYDKQIKAIREGINYIVPLNIIDGFFTHSQLETLICGKLNMNIDLLRSQTEYSIDRNDIRVGFLFTLLEQMTPEQQALFLRFCWGRSRLPLSITGFNGRKFKIESLTRGNNPDSILPEACTCFFTLKVPLYTTIDIMRERLIYAIYNCVAIDMDQEAVDRSEWRD